MIVPDAIYNVETSRMTQIISNAIVDFYTQHEHKYQLPLRIPESVILNKKEDLQFLYYVMYAAILVGDERFNFYYDVYEKHGLFTEELLARTDFNGDCLAFAYFRIYQRDIPLMMRTAYMAEYINQYTHETWPSYSQHQLKYLDINHLRPKVVELKDTVCEICMGEEDTRFLKTVCGHHIHAECYKMLSKEQQLECPVCRAKHWIEKEIL